MPGCLQLTLTSEARRALEAVRDHHPRPYLRERAAALLKVAVGSSGRAVATTGLLQGRRPDTVYAWVHRFQAEGLAGLQIRPGRGRKPSFSPSAPRRRKRAGGTPLSRPVRSAHSRA